MPAISTKINLSIYQMMKLVIFFAVAFASIAPMVHLWQAGVVEGGAERGLVFVAIFGAVLVPLEWIGMSLILVRRGPWRENLIVCLLLCSVLVALGTACWMLIYHFIPALRRISVRGDVVTSILIALAVILVLSAASVFLMGKLIRGHFHRGAG
jgi:hypothetical protein